MIITKAFEVKLVLLFDQLILGSCFGTLLVCFSEQAILVYENDLLPLALRPQRPYTMGVA